MPTTGYPAIAPNARLPAMTPPAPIQTSTQLGVGNARMLWRGLLQRCPACGGGHTHRGWFTFVDRCPTCDLRFERIEGHSIGYIGLNTIVTFSATFVVLLVGTIIMHPHIRVWPLLFAALVPGLLLPLLFTPSSHTLWTAIDLIMRPLRTGEIDPRFIEVEPTD